MGFEIAYAFDTETTGEAPPDAAICELAAVPVTREGKVVLSKSVTTLINPGHKVPCDARAVHHISDQELLKAPKLSAVMKRQFKFLRGKGVVIAAHNMEFDLQFMQPELTGEENKVCTYRVARHLYPDAPNFKNQTLRYYLDVDPPKSALKGMVPHRALYDTICTAFILAKMVREVGLDEIVRLSSEPVLLKTCHLKKHKGIPWAEVPVGYLQWILKADFDLDVVHTARHHLGLGKLPSKRVA